MQKKNYNPNHRNRKFRPPGTGGGKPRPANNSSLPGVPRDTATAGGGGGRKNPRYRTQHAPVHIEPGDPATYYKVTGVLEMHPDGYGFLRDPTNDYTRIITDPFVP